MITTIILIIPLIIAVIITIHFMKKSIKRKEWGQLALEIGALVNAAFILFVILSVYFTVN